MHSKMEKYKYLYDSNILEAKLTDVGKYPMMIRNNGLLNFWEYLKNKDNKDKEIDFFKFTIKEKTLSGAEEIIEHLKNLPTDEYRDITMEVYELASILKLKYEKVSD